MCSVTLQLILHYFTIILVADEGWTKYTTYVDCIWYRSYNCYHRKL